MEFRSLHKSKRIASPILQFKRIVVKAGTNVLTNRTKKLDASMMSALATQIIDLRALGAQVILVTSGAIAAGREVLSRTDGSKGVPVRQTLAAIGQSRLMHAYQDLFSRDGITVAQALLTRHDVEDRVGYLNIRNTLHSLLNRGVLPIVNENDVVNIEEIGPDQFGDNDQLSTLVANLIDADLLVILTDTAGLYTSDPHEDPNATLVNVVDRIDDAVISMAGNHKSTTSRGGMVSKLSAARVAVAGGVPVIIASGSEPKVLVRCAIGENVGTLFSPSVNPIESRKRWLLSQMSRSGKSLIVDNGAAIALQNRHGSLLPAGVRQIIGSFERGDVVAVGNIDGEQIACGISNYDSKDLENIIGTRSDQIFVRLGHHFGDEVIHRNNMVLL
jgi:glutamate 5-kinase